jgi:hypothetical protein
MAVRSHGAMSRLWPRLGPVALTFVQVRPSRYNGAHSHTGIMMGVDVAARHSSGLSVVPGRAGRPGPAAQPCVPKQPEDGPAACRSRRFRAVLMQAQSDSDIDERAWVVRRSSRPGGLFGWGERARASLSATV